MKIGIFVGSFNPVHKGHIQIINKVLEEKVVDKVLVIATGNYWDKTDIININHRINMLEKYARDDIIIDKTLNDLPYTYLVMRELKNRYKNDELFLIIGADNIISFDKWREYKELLEYNLIIMNRNNIDVKHYLDLLNKKDKYYIIDIEYVDISSTSVRNNINNVERLKELLDDEIIDYIKENNLYEGD